LVELGVEVAGDRLGEQLAIQVQIHHLAPIRVLNGTGRSAADTRLSPKTSDSRSCWTLSPSSGIHPAMKTGACTCSFPVAALDIAAPP
jgi:hypothetical protein